MSSEISDVSAAWAEGDSGVSKDEQVDVITGPTNIRGVYLCQALVAASRPAGDTMVSFWDVVGGTSTQLFKMCLPSDGPVASVLLPDDGYVRCDGDLKVSVDNTNGAAQFRVTVFYTGGSEA